MENENLNFRDKFKKRLYAWVLRLIGFIDKLPKDSVCGVIGKQVLRSGTSILANFTEANSATSRKDYINFFSYSLKSANGSEMWLALLRDTKRDALHESEWLLKELGEISNILASSILKLKGKR